MSVCRNLPGSGVASGKSKSNVPLAVSKPRQEQTPYSAPSEQDALIMKQVQEMVNTAGGSGCVVDNILPLTDPESDNGMMVIRCRNRGQRTCLVTRGEVHVDNNAYILVCPDGKVLYKCKGQDCKGRYLELGKLSEPDSEISDDDESPNEAPNGDVTTPEDQSLNDGGDDCIPLQHELSEPDSEIDEASNSDVTTPEDESSIDGGHDDAMHDLDEGARVNITSGLSKRTATSISVGDDLLVENDRKKVCRGNLLQPQGGGDPPSKTESSMQTCVFFESPFDKMFSLDVIQSLGSETTTGCKVLMARASRFQSGPGRDAPGVASQGNTYRDPPGGFLLTARRDKRSTDFRIKLYVEGVVKAAERGHG